MTAYLDSSVLLRVAFGEPGRLVEWESIERGVVSALVSVECLRTIDRLRLRHSLAPEDVAERRETVFRLLEALDVVELTGPVLARAAQPLPTPLGTLDAIHLATALLWQERGERDLVVATHDAALAMAARSCGLAVVGVGGSTPGSRP